MTTIFDYIKDIVVKKTGELPLDNYVPFLVNRWLSFINPTCCQAIGSLNSKVFLENKELHYKMLLSLFPKMKYCPKITYIKKVKETENKDTDIIAKRIAERFEISIREALFLMDGLD